MPIDLTLPRMALLLVLAVIVLLLGLWRSASARAGGAGDRATALYPGSELIVRNRISVEVVGRGPDLVFVPGLSSSRATWRATADRLKDRYRLHLVQVAGFAGEPARGNASGGVILPTAEDIHAYLAETHMIPATIVGHSLGGTMALYLAQKHPADVAKLMIVDALPFLGVLYGGPDATSESLEAMTQSWGTAHSGWTPEMAERMVAYMVTAPEDAETIRGWMRTSDASVVGRAFREDIVLDLRPGLPGISAPVTLLYPDFAPQTTSAAAWDALHEDAFASVPRKTIMKIEKSRHFIMFDRPDRFFEALDIFLAK